MIRIRVVLWLPNLKPYAQAQLVLFPFEYVKHVKLFYSPLLFPQLLN